MRIAVYSLTRDRLFYTQACFASLRKFAGCEFDHFVIDNGSEDETVRWLVEEYKPKLLRAFAENQGISLGSNEALNLIAEYAIKGRIKYDVIAKIDNDCLLSMENTLGQMAEIVMDSGREFSSKYLLSPRVTGINNQPTRGRDTMIVGRRVGLTAIVGGLFHVARAEVYQAYRYPATLPVAWGQDDVFCKWFKRFGGEVGYVEDIVVSHFEGTDAQAQRYPEYFQRKWIEEKEMPEAPK